MHLKAFLKILWIVLSTIALIEARLSKCHSKMLRDCFCGEQFVDTESHFVVNCTNLGFTNTSMLQELPEEITMLIFVGNHVNTLSSNVFGDLDLSDLKVIDMSNNGIREIKGKAFHHVSSVKRLILNHNNISISEEDDGNFHHPRVFSNFINLEELHLTNAFADNTDAQLADDLHDIFVNSDLKRLYKIHLEQNEIKNFKDERVFCDLPELHDLYLGDNNIPHLNFNISCIKKLRFLDLERNNISKFTNNDLENFDKLAPPLRKERLLLEIGGNPFRCDQAIKNLYNWLIKTNVKVRNVQNLECHQSKFGRRYILNLKNLAESKHAKISQALTVLLAILVVILFTLLMAYVYLKRDNVRKKLSPVIEAVTRKVQYTTIESQDV